MNLHRKSFIRRREGRLFTPQSTRTQEKYNAFIIRKISVEHLSIETDLLFLLGRRTLQWSRSRLKRLIIIRQGMNEENRL